jgi:protein TonB
MPPKDPKFDVQRKYQRMFEIGIILSISILILAFRYFPEIKSEPRPIEPIKEYVDVEDVIRTEDLQKPPTPPKPVFPIDVELEDDNLPDIEIETSELDENANVEKVKTDIPNDEEVISYKFRVVEEMPEIIGGLEALQKKVFYPEIAVKAGIQGKVFVETVIGKDGNPEEIKVLKGIGAGCDESAVEAIRKTKFLPGKQRGKPVRVIIVIPISFVLNN